MPKSNQAREKKVRNAPDQHGYHECGTKHIAANEEV
jgi:hypothetical protein